jgi:hypothetical protein
MNKTAELTPEARQQLGKEVLQSALAGGGLSIGAAGLYHLINGLQTAEMPEVSTRLSNGAIPTKKKKQLGRVAPNTATAYLLNTYKKASVKQANNPVSKALHSVQDFIGQLAGARPPMPFPISSGMADRSWRNIVNAGAAGLGAYGGLHLVNRVADSKRKEDLKDSVEEARKEYFEALTGKGEKTALLKELWERVGPAVENTTADYMVTPALAAMLGSGLVGGTYMYNQTKDRTRAENLRRAAAARARLQSIQQTPWVDPAELAALTKK